MFRMGFLQGGGFSQVLRVLMASPASSTGADRDVILGHASALRILKTCLFYPPLTGVGLVGGNNGAEKGCRGKAAPAGISEGGGVLMVRDLPLMASPTPAALKAMKVAESDLQQLLDKLVLVSHDDIDGNLKNEKEV